MQYFGNTDLTAIRCGCFVCYATTALPLLGFSPKILGFSKQSWVLGFFAEDLGFFQGFSKGPWVFLGFFKICQKIHLFLLWRIKRLFLGKVWFFQEKCDFFQKFSENV